MDQQNTEGFFAVDRIAETRVVQNSTSKYEGLGYQEIEDENAIKSYKSTWNEVEHVLLTRNGQSLDLMSVVRRLNKHRTIFSFFGPGFYAPNEYQQNPTVVVPIKRGENGWNEKDFVCCFLHEKSHEALSSRHYGHIGWGLTNAQKEREVNANSAQAIRQLATRLPQQFINLEGFMQWANNQLRVGYDRRECQHAGRDYLASNQARSGKSQDQAPSTIKK